MESQNCWEPVIHEKEGVINAFVKEALDSLEERLTRTAEGASDEYMVKLEEEEYAKAVKILTDTYAECPHVKHIQDALDKPDFIWDSLFIEDIGPDAVNKWYRNPSFDENVRKQKEKARMELEIDAFINDMEQKLAERKAALNKDEPKEYTFGHNLKDGEIEALTKCVNEVNMFRTKECVTEEQLKSILDCHPKTIFKARSNRLVAHFFDQLSIHHFITNEWQAVIAKNQLIMASRKKGCINQNDLSVAVNYLRTNFLEEEYTTIEECIKELKTLREKEKNEKKGK